MKRAWRFISSFVLIAFLITFISSLVFIYSLTRALPKLELPSLTTSTPTLIEDYRDQTVLTLNAEVKKWVTFDELSDDFINALISIEDERFFIHEGIDIQRLLGSIYANVTEGAFRQGASTLSQQLIKNTIVGDETSLTRKIKEAALAYELEKQFSKEDILTAYANYIYFDGITPGVNSASLRFFGKEINEVSLPEAALLAALVKSPTQYSPIHHPEAANERKNLVLEAMTRNGYISDYQKNIAQAFTIEDLLFQPSPQSEPSYPYQAYLDIVFAEVQELTGLDPYATPMRIKTYLNKELQHQLDRIQSGEESTIVFEDAIQQMAATVIDNQTGAVIGVIGGRNYQGQRLFNRAYHMRQQPASTIKPLLSYALAVEHLGWSNVHVVKDIPYTYPGTDLNVDNVDFRYLGDVTLEEALGYSRNTSALTTLEEVRKQIGMSGISDHLAKMGLLDVEPHQVNMAYGLGAMYEGVSPMELAAAYAMLPRGGNYQSPTTLRSVELLDGSNRVFYPDLIQEKVISKETAFIISNVLQNVVEKNYFNIGSVKIPNVSLAVKTGTSSFAEDLRAKYGYPTTASKDLWVTGFSPDFTVVVWTGFDQLSKTEKTYFSTKDTRTPILRQTFKTIMQWVAQPGLKINPPATLVTAPVVLGTYPYLLPDEYTPSDLIGLGYFLPNQVPTQTITPPTLPAMGTIEALFTENQLAITLPSLKPVIPDIVYGKTIFSVEKIYGPITYVVEITFNDQKTVLKSEQNTFSIPLLEAGMYQIEAYYQYEKLDDSKGESAFYEIELKPNLLDWIFGLVFH